MSGGHVVVVDYLDCKPIGGIPVAGLPDTTIGFEVGVESMSTQHLHNAMQEANIDAPKRVKAKRHKESKHSGGWMPAKQRNAKRRR